ncbi:MAG: corrinoid protein [Rhodospirillales bacterium]|jgi:5-methyltetrahydrofolate--homocysteine methyltransferase|nr:corrinoid protein [Rhodospirillales bacterium]
MTTLDAVYQNVLEGNLAGTADEVGKAIDAGVAPEEILQSLTAGITEVGRKFEIGEYFVPEMMIAARAMQNAMAILKPKLVAVGAKPIGKVVIGTVQGDLHDVGKNIVSMMLEGVGFEIVDLGTNVSTEQFIQAVQETEAQVVAFSALLTTTMSEIGVSIEALKQKGLRDNVTVMVGGAPITQSFADKVGADIYASDGSAAAREAKQAMAA